MNKERWTAVFFMAASLIFCVTAVSFAAIGMLETKRERLEREARESGRPAPNTLYQKIHENFLREDYAAVDKLSKGYLSGGSGWTETEDVLYLQALSLLKLGRSAEAREKLKEIENRSSSKESQANASASIGDSYFYEANELAAYESYKETLSKYPASDQTAYVLGRLCELSPKLGHAGEAEDFRNRLVKEYLASQETRNLKPFTPTGSLKQISLEENHFYTVQVGSFARPENAQGLLGRLIRQHYDAYLAPDNEGQHHRVRVGRLATRKKAEALETDLKRRGYPTKILP